MTKKDYPFLAICLRKRIAAARLACETSTDETAARQSLATWVDTAREIAEGLHVEKSAFLHACGIK